MKIVHALYATLSGVYSTDYNHLTVYLRSLFGEQVSRDACDQCFTLAASLDQVSSIYIEK